MDKIELADAVIAVSGSGPHATIAVFRYLDPRGNGYDYTWGACESRWQDDPSIRFQALFEVTMFLMRSLLITAEQIAQALRVIPECAGLFDD